MTYESPLENLRNRDAGDRDVPKRILALLPFLVKDALSLAVLREMRLRGCDICIAWCMKISSHAPDPIEEFRSEHRILDLTAVRHRERRTALHEVIATQRTQLVLQIGAAPLYQILPFLRGDFPNLAIVDVLYNEVGHTVNHFLFERCMDGVIVESQHMRSFVEAASEKRRPEVRIVENGVDIAMFRPLPGPAIPRLLTLGYIGRLSPEKNPLGFIELAENLAPEFPGIRFEIYGDGPMTGDVACRLAASPVRDRVKVNGYVADVVSALHRVDVLVVPSRLDGRPNVIMEANACAVPVLASPVGGIPEMIEEGRNGYLVAADDFRRVKQLVGEWLAKPAALEKLRASTRATAEERFDRCRMMDAYERTFDEFIALAVRRSPVGQTQAHSTARSHKT